MKTKDQELARRGADNIKHDQESAAAHDHPEQRKAGIKQAQAKAKKQKEKQSD